MDTCNGMGSNPKAQDHQVPHKSRSHNPKDFCLVHLYCESHWLLVPIEADQDTIVLRQGGGERLHDLMGGSSGLVICLPGIVVD